MAEQGFGGVLAVGKASDSKPRFIIIEYGAELADADRCLVGKGITFDSGGLSIKPEDGMLNMKNDMGGAAAVFGTMQVAAELGLPVHLVGLVPSAENMISGTPYRPGDVITTLSGKTIEVLNTDAEGRLILSDGLFYAQRTSRTRSSSWPPSPARSSSRSARRHRGDGQRPPSPTRSSPRPNSRATGRGSCRCGRTTTT